MRHLHIREMSDRLVDAVFARGDVAAVVARLREPTTADADHLVIAPVQPAAGLGELEIAERSAPSLPRRARS